MSFILIIYILRECPNDRDEAPDRESGGLPREWVGRGGSKRAPGGEEEDQMPEVLCLYGLGKGQWFRGAGM